MKFALLFITASVFCSVSSVVSEDLRIGAVLGFTGPAQHWADNARKGMELGLEEVNAQAAPSGKKVSIAFEDSRSEPKSAVTAYRKLVDQSEVQVVLGDVWTFLTIPLVSLAARDKVILISPTVMEGSMTDTSDYFFSFGHRFAGLEKAVGRFFDLNPAVKHLGFISFEDYWNNGFTDMVRKVAAPRGIAVTQDIRLNDFFPDLRTEITLLKRAVVDGVVVTWRPEVAAQRMKEQKLAVPVLTSSDMVEAVLYRGGDKVALEGAYYLDWKPSAEFSKKFSARFGQEPLYEAQNSYEIIRSLGKALAKNEDLRTALLSVKYQGVDGTIDFSRAPYVNQSPGKLFKVSNGALVAVE